MPWPRSGSTELCKKMNNQAANDRIAGLERKGLYNVGGAAALIAAALFLIAAIELLFTRLRPGVTPLMDNWLVVIFKLHTGFSGVQIDRLNVFNYLDLALLALVGVTVLGLYAALKDVSKIWSVIALIQPFLGMALFIATKNAGRSSVMGAVMVISVVMLQSNMRSSMQGNMRHECFHKGLGYMGILAGVLLFIGDLTAGVLHSNMIAYLFSIGYVLLILWLFLVARRLFQLGHIESSMN